MATGADRDRCCTHTVPEDSESAVQRLPGTADADAAANDDEPGHRAADASDGTEGSWAGVPDADDTWTGAARGLQRAAG